MTEYPPGSAAPYTSQPGGNLSEYPYGETVPAVTESYDTTASTMDTESPSMSEKASNTVDAGKQAAADVAQTATEKAKDVALETKKQARDLIGEARSQVSQQAGAQHRNLVDNLHSLAGELNTMAERSDGGGMATDLVSQAGDRVHTVAEWFGQREPGDLLQEARQFARQRPGAFLIGAAVAGVLVGRLTRGVVAAHSEDEEPPHAETAYTVPRYDTPAPVVPAAPLYGDELGYGAAGNAYSAPPAVGYGSGIGGEVTP